ncbi:glycoside hydrolase family 6 protein [Nonomuraea sediminis]|uniref:glycoside hydrolase family 6 protein n=1 Tax=Nonomuraea sediminis TaxID=2835864 RepID=UPI0027DFDFA7|nr:glycoside hydrolase family 6 protein [Nonomuraea sediminis]
MRRLSALVAVLVAMVGLTALPAQAATELIKNGTFGTTNPDNWWSSTAAPIRIETGRLRVDVASVANPWDAIVGQSGLSLTQGKSYTLAFDAYSSVAYTARTTVQLESSPSTQPLSQDVALTTASRRFSFPFTWSAASTTGGAQVTFQLGGHGAAVVRFDNVSLQEAANPISGTTGLYVDDQSHPAQWVSANRTSDPGRASAIDAGIATKPIFQWFGDWFPNPTNAVTTYVNAAQAQNKLPMLVAYNVTKRDSCATQSTGGAPDEPTYQTWITNFANAIGTRPAIVVLEPDAIPGMSCLDGNQQALRLRELNYALDTLRAKAPNAWTYLDAGNSTWGAATDIARWSDQAGLRKARGFSLNVSNFFTTADTGTRAGAVNAELTKYGYTKPYVIDTSRNGNGPYTGPPINDSWCNPPGRKLGTPPKQQQTGAEFLLWVKVPGDSDGSCNTGAGIPAGTFDPGLAMHLINGD